MNWGGIKSLNRFVSLRINACCSSCLILSEKKNLYLYLEPSSGILSHWHKRFRVIGPSTKWPISSNSYTAGWQSTPRRVTKKCKSKSSCVQTNTVTKTSHTNRIKLDASIRFSSSHRIDYTSSSSSTPTFNTKSRRFSSPNHHKTPSCIKSVITEGSRQFVRSIRSITSRGRLSQGVSFTRWSKGEETARESGRMGATWNTIMEHKRGNGSTMAYVTSKR